MTGFRILTEEAGGTLNLVYSEVSPTFIVIGSRYGFNLISVKDGPAVEKLKCCYKAKLDFISTGFQACELHTLKGRDHEDDP